MDSDQRSCRNCPAPVLWATTNNGKRTLLDEPNDQGAVALLVPIGASRTQAFAVALQGDALKQARAAGVELRTVHFLTCSAKSQGEERAAA